MHIVAHRAGVRCVQCAAMTAAPSIPVEALRLSVAPMMDWTDTHCRAFHRVLAPHARLYTEMVHANAVIHGDRAKLLAMDRSEHPVALQLGGSEPELLAQAARIGAEAGFDEVNLNCGCPSDRVQAGRFGACLMREPQRVAASVAAMIEAVSTLPRPVPVTVKCRLGVDDDHDWGRFLAFVDAIAGAGCRMFVVHARNAWLQGLSPKENREVPPLRYDWAYRLKAERPALQVVVNGGIADRREAGAHLEHVDGCTRTGPMSKRNSPVASRSSTSSATCSDCSPASRGDARSGRC
jgi:tRNA-dihydrouridine synthase A